MPDSPPPPETGLPELAELKLLVAADLHRAFQRCLWIRVNEAGQTPLQVMDEVVRDFLKKHGC
ncbi:MAG: hypothetical protein LBD10_04780 [Desulfobulbus sp.]|jgi:uridine kinase|uniref:hypothetical protein n=1 Tax=Desulfobulbus sp. TaxID=895 RepID=UPI002843E736|nr:hypothetical protein [Desulfobulbus sp.]MDR2549500.1 hypothetical protein [Desulfobulbus sp.]